jgi:hypothetical protein
MRRMRSFVRRSVPWLPATWELGIANEAAGMRRLSTNRVPGSIGHRCLSTLASALAVAVIALLALAAGARADHDEVAHPPGDVSRAYELVSPPYKVSGNGAGEPRFSEGPAQAFNAGVGAHVGERFAVSGTLGAMLLEAPFATATDWALAERGPGEVGWLSHSPVTHSFQDSENYRMMFMQESTPDLSTMMWIGNAGDLPFFEEMGPLGVENDGSSLVSDWGDPPERPSRWEPIGPLTAGQRTDGRPSNLNVFWAPAVSADGSHLAVSGGVRGLAGPGDPTLDAVVVPQPQVLVPGLSSAYVDDVSAGLSDSWPGAGVRTPAAACTGQDGGQAQSRTRIPLRNGDGSLGEQACAPKAPDRDSRLVSDRGSSITWQGADQTIIGTSSANVISRDGSRVFVMAPDPAPAVDLDPVAAGIQTTACAGSLSDGATSCPTQLYVRQKNTDGEVVTRWISRPEADRFDDPMAAALLGPAYFEGASADGSRVFFRTDTPLTVDDPNGATQTPANPDPTTVRSARSWDLYMFELAPGPDGDPATADGDPTGPGSRLTRISAGPAGVSDCSVRPTVVGTAALRFVSEDGERVYFSCAAPLGGIVDRATGTAAGTQGGTPSTHLESNIYLYDATEADPSERYTFVARIPSTPSGSSGNGNLTRCASTAALRGQSVLTNPEVFAIQAVSCWRGSDDGALATFWTLGRLTDDDPHEFGPGASADIYAYDADSDQLVRISAPQGPVDETYQCGPPLAPTRCYADPGMHGGAYQAAANPLLNVAVDPVSGERAVFFESEARLVDGDENSVFDVYRWQDGVLSLVSSGAAGSDGTTYKGNSIDGKNVYLATRDRLTWQDVDSVLDVYTARVGGGISEPGPVVVCVVLSGGCHGGDAPASGSVVRTAVPAAGGAGAGVRARLSIGALGARARRAAARRGVIRVGVRVSRPGVVRVGARARIGGRSVKVAGARRRFARPGAATVRLRLSRRARRALDRGEVLRVRLRAALSGARGRSATVVLKRGNR